MLQATVIYMLQPLCYRNLTEFGTAVICSANGHEVSVADDQSLKNTRVWDWNLNTWIDIVWVISLALQAEDSTSRAQTETLEILDKTASCSARLAGSPWQGHWTARLYRSVDICTRCPESFLEHAVSCGLTLYVRSVLGKSSYESTNFHEARSLLDFATWFVPERTITHEIKPAMVAMLIKNGSHPNERCYGSTPWRKLLDFLAQKYFDNSYREFMGPVHPSWLETCKLYIMGGADLRVEHWYPERKYMTAWQILSVVFENQAPEKLSELKCLFEERGAFTEQKHKQEVQQSLHQQSQLSRKRPRSPARDQYLPRVRHDRTPFRDDDDAREMPKSRTNYRSWDHQRRRSARRTKYNEDHDRDNHRRRQYDSYRPGG